MELKKFQDQFESREAIDQFYSYKKLFKVFEKTNIWLEIFENNKGFYVCIDKLEVEKIWFGICKLCSLNCSWCEKNRLLFMSKIRFHTKTMLGKQRKRKKFKLVLWRIYLNINKCNFELEHVFKSD